MNLTTEAKTQIIEHVKSVLPNEACGFLVEDGFVQCINIHPKPNESFAISAEDYAKAEGRSIIAVFHSHTGKNNKFSQHDIKSCKSLNTPWLMYCYGTNSWHYMDPTGNAPYTERQWVYGVHDCYGLVRDYYKNEFGILLDDFERNGEFEWTSPEWRMFESNFKEQGFIAIEGSELRRGDIFLMQLQATNPNHVGVLHSPETGVFYHHLLDRLSEANVYGGYWKKCTNKILRHQGLM